MPVPYVPHMQYQDSKRLIISFPIVASTSTYFLHGCLAIATLKSKLQWQILQITWLQLERFLFACCTDFWHHMSASENHPVWLLCNTWFAVPSIPLTQTSDHKATAHKRFLHLALQTLDITSLWTSEKKPGCYTTLTSYQKSQGLAPRDSCLFKSQRRSVSLSVPAFWSKRLRLRSSRPHGLFNVYSVVTRTLNSYSASLDIESSVTRIGLPVQYLFTKDISCILSMIPYRYMLIYKYTYIFKS